MICNKCGRDKLDTEFYARRKYCKDCHNSEQRRVYRIKADARGVTTKELRKQRSLEKVKELGFVVVNETKIDNVYTVDVICPHCNNIFRVKRKSLVAQHTKSCGCANLGKRKGSKYISGNFMTRLVNGAVSRGFDVTVSVEDIESLLIKQDFKCALTGWELKCGYVDLTEYTLSADRIDSTKGYHLDNIQLVHKRVNIAKNSSSQQEFIEMCKAIARNN